MIDIDGTIAELKKQGQTYKNVRLNEGAAEKIKALKKAGHYIILQTARHMKTCDGDTGKVVAKIGKETLDWLLEHDVLYDEIYFGKPYADVYLDDLAHKFTSWDAVDVNGFDDEKLNIVIPIAGAGSRFVDAGFDVPKPLIKVHDKTLIEWSVKSFDFLKKTKKVSFIFIILKEHDKKYALKKSLKNIFGNTIKIIVIDEMTRGQAETCLMAKSLIDNYNQLVIYNCDTYTTGNSKMFDLIEKERPDGILACFKSNDPRYSYARLDSFGYVDLTKEKEVISPLATSGMYYFKRGSDFVTAAENMIKNDDDSKGEYYVAPCYNEMLKSGKKIKTYLVDENWVIGTPEEFENFERKYKR